MRSHEPGAAVAPIRRARTLIMYHEGELLVALNYLSKKSCILSPLATSLLASWESWRVPGEVVARYAVFDPIVLEEIARLLSASILVERGTFEGEQDEIFESDFAWGAPAGYYHFTIRNTEYMDPARFSAWMTAQVETKPTVPLFRDHKESASALPLPPARETELMSVMRRRRSFRGFSDAPVTLAELSDCLFAGLGITGFIKGSFGEGYLPLAMTPSGGGRNPYEAFVYVRNVEGLEAGTYHYSAADHSLELMPDRPMPRPGDVLARQPWFDNTAALVLLVADFARTMWKYPHPTGYRVVVLEAGHIAQNIILAATAQGLASAPTCALSDATAEALTGRRAMTTTTMYSIALGRKSAVPTSVDPLCIIPNKAMSAPRNAT